MSDYIKGEREQSETDEKIEFKESIVSQEVLFSPKANNGLGHERVSTFWAAIKLGWLRRLGKESFWKTLHIEDLKDKSLLFNPYNANELLLKKAIKNLNNPVMKQVYISLLHCKSNLIEIDPTQSLFLPLFGEHRVTKNNMPALCEWAIGTRMIDLLSTNGNYLPDHAYIKHARRQPSQFQISSLKNRLKGIFNEIYNSAERRQLHEMNPFNIYMVE